MTNTKRTRTRPQSRRRLAPTGYAVTVSRCVTRELFSIDPETWEYQNDRGGFQVRHIPNGPLYDQVIGDRGHRIPTKKREVLGAGGAGSQLSSLQVGSLDLFRYSAPGVRSYTTDPNAKPYFSINGGISRHGYFNQDSAGDYGDWNHDLNGTPQVQDAFSTPGLQLNLDGNELAALDIVGYHIIG